MLHYKLSTSYIAGAAAKYIFPYKGVHQKEKQIDTKACHTDFITNHILNNEWGLYFQLAAVPTV